MKFNKVTLRSMATVLLSAGLLIGCGVQDEQEPDPTEEPSEQQQEEGNGTGQNSKH